MRVRGKAVPSHEFKLLPLRSKTAREKNSDTGRVYKIGNYKILIGFKRMHAIIAGGQDE
jgi:hypothetical protein